jgi:hypothetical protein
LSDLLLYVDGSLKRTEPATPQGRRRMDGAAFEALRGSDDVRVVPSEAVGSETGTLQVRSMGAPGASPVPVPVSHRAACCKPSMYPGPSGLRYRHAWDCKASPGQTFSTAVASVTDIGQARLSRRHAIESRRTGLDGALSSHPSAYLSAASHAAWHPGESAEDCIECSERAD